MDDMLRRSIGPLIRVHYQLAEQCWPVLVDRVQLEVALLNLAVNARDAMPLGGDLILSTQTISNAEAVGLTPGDYVLIAMTDSGSGMTDEVRSRAFEPFYTTKEQGKGTGLGLSMVYGYATQIGGTVTLDSSIGQGTTVRLFLPRAVLPASSPMDQSEQPDRQLPTGAVRVLLVDDDDSVRLSAQAIIEDLGHTVITAESGPRALQILAEYRLFDVLLLDFAMPIMTGAQLASEITRIWPNAPIAFMTGYVETDVLRPWLHRGVRTVRKPFSSADLKEIIEHLARRGSKASNVITLRK
jgi:CheY-like chemotaxis protein